MAALAAEGGPIPVPRDPRAYLVDFLPVLHRRSLQRDGIRIDHLTYFSPVLRIWITARDRPEPLLVRRDPHDLSRPAISLWEHRLVRRRLRARHRGGVDETALYAAVEEMRAAEREAACLTRSARRDRARRGAGGCARNGSPERVHLRVEHLACFAGGHPGIADQFHRCRALACSRQSRPAQLARPLIAAGSS